MKKTLIKNLFIEYHDSLFLSVIFSLVFGSLGANLLKAPALSSIFFKGQFVVLFAWFLIILIRVVLRLRKHQYQKTHLFCFVLCISIIVLSYVSVSIDLVLNNQSIFQGFDYYSKFLVFCEVIIFLFAMYDGRYQKAPFILLKTLSLAFSLLIIISFITGFARTWSGLQQWRLLTLNFSNPNTAGLILSVMVVLLLFSLFTSRSKIIKVLSFITTAFLIVLLYFTSSRTGLIAALISLPLAYFIKSIAKKHHLTTNVVLVLFPLFFLSLYFIIFTIRGGGYYISPAVANGAKSSDTRYDVWYTALSNVRIIPFFGNYYTVSGGTGSFHMHNTLIDLFVGFGTVVALLSILFLLFICVDSFGHSRYKTNKIFIPLLFVVSIFFLGTFESFPFYSPNGLAFLSLSFVALYKVPFNKFIFEEKIEHSKVYCDVLLINNVFQFGSTGKIVEDCHNYYRKKGLESYVIYGRNKHNENDNYVSCVESNLEVRICQILNRILCTESVGCWYMTREIIYCIKYMKPRLIHIHSFNDDFVNFKILLSYLSRNNIKVVCTLHSEHMLLGNCGGCSFGCDKYSCGCQNCHKAGRNPIKKYFASHTNELKQTLFDSFEPENLVFTCVSPWLLTRFMKTKLSKRFKVFTVLNGSRFAMYSYGADAFNNERKQIMYVTPSFNNENKGFDYFVKLALAFENERDYTFIAIGMDNYYKSIPSNLSIINNVTDANILANYYSNSCLTVICSKTETFSMPVIESLLSGTPIVGFKSGGPESIALRRYSLFVDYGDFKGLIKAVKLFANKNFDKTSVREEAKQEYSINNMAENYLLVYKLFKNEPISIKHYKNVSYCEIDI